MKNWIQSLCAVFCFFLTTSAWAEHTRVTNPNALSFEGLGRNLVYGLSYDRVMDDHSVAGASFGSATAGGSATGILSAHYHFLFLKEQGSPYVGAGFGFATHHSAVEGKKTKVGNLQFGSSPLFPNVTLGYENRTDLGFLFRIGGYVFFAKNVVPWLGVSFGYAF